MMPSRAGGTSHIPSRQVLAALPARVVSFLRAIGTNHEIRAAMLQGGYREDDHTEGFALLNAVCRYDTVAPTAHASSASRGAEQEIVAWVRCHLARLIAAVERIHPDAVHLFAGIESPDPTGSVLALATLLARLDELEPSDRPVLPTLARRGVGEKERARLKALVAAAHSAPMPVEPPPRRDTRQQELLALYRWYSDWSVTAHAVIDRKALRIALGIASRAPSAPPLDPSQAEGAGE